MPVSGGCHCGAVTYAIKDGAQPAHHAMCHCTDCRRASGAPAVAWALFGQDEVVIVGSPARYKSSDHAERHFCASCGTSLFYTSAQIFPGQIDVQSATLDDPETFPLGAQVQTAERVSYMEHLSDIVAFDRYPGEE